MKSAPRLLSFCLTLSIVCGTVAISQAAEINAAPDTAARTRVINFPDRGLGQYFVDEKKDTFMDQWGDEEKPKPAKGKVRVSESGRVTLATGWGVDAGIANLRFLKPDDLYGLDVQGSQVDSENIKYICALKGLKRLVISGCFIKDADITRLATSLPALEEFELASMRFMTDRSLETISRMKNLRLLSIEDNTLTDAGFSKLAESRTLQSLNVRRNDISDSTLASIARIKSLSTLNLALTRVTTRGLKPLLTTPSLKRLDLTKTKIDDQSIKEVIGQLTQLEALNLSGTQVTDAGIGYLDKLGNLRKLWLMGLKRVTNSSIPKLARHLKLEDLELQKSGIDVTGVQTLGKLLPRSEVHAKYPCHCKKRERVNW